MDKVVNQMLKQLKIKEITIATHSLCNFRCSFCPYPIFEEKYKMAPDDVYKLIDTISEYPEIEWVHLDDVNEPLIDPHIFDYIKAIQDKNKKVCLTTNGILLGKKEIINLLKKQMPDVILISVHTFTKEDFEKTRGNRIDFNKYLNNITEGIAEIHPFLHDHKFIRIEVGMHFPQILRKVLGISLGEKTFYPDIERLCEGVINFLELLKKHLSFPIERVKTDVLNNIRLGRRGKKHKEYIPITSNLDFYLKGMDDWINYFRYKKSYFVRCHPSYILIRANGDLIRCCHDFKGETKMGNVFTTPFPEIIKNNYQTLSKSLTGNPGWEICKKCKGAPTYRGALVFRPIYNFINNLSRKGRLQTLLKLEEKQ